MLMMNGLDELANFSIINTIIYIIVKFIVLYLQKIVYIQILNII